MEITDAQYKEFLADQQRLKTVEAENAKMSETAENTKIALKEGREAQAALKASNEELAAKLQAETTAKADLEAKVQEVETLKNAADKWNAHETATKEARKTGIEEMKTKLWEEFMTANAAFLDGLGDDKVELYLKSHVEALGTEKKTVIVGTDGKGGKPVTQTTEFDNAIKSGDYKTALANIPLPGAK